MTAIVRVTRGTLSASTWPARSLATETRRPVSAAFAAVIASHVSSLPFARRIGGSGPVTSSTANAGEGEMPGQAGAEAARCSTPT
ncbi:MAG: hypothetical protein ACR2H2_19860 [Solirubrobacteraceae bacterium]